MESCAAELERKVWSVRAEFGEGCTVLSTGLTKSANYHITKRSMNGPQLI